MDHARLLMREDGTMKEIPVLRMYTKHIEKKTFVAIAEHLGLRGDPVATKEALFMQGKQSALAYAMPGSRFAGLLFFTDQSNGVGAPIERAPGKEAVETWTHAFLKRFELGPRESSAQEIRASYAMRVSLTESAIENDKKGKDVKHVPIKTDVIFDVQVNDLHVTGPRAKVRLTFKNAKAPVWIHRALWEAMEVFEARPMLTEDEVYRKVKDRLSRRGETMKMWQMLDIRLAYFAGEYSGGPDLLLPYYFAELEHRDPKDKERMRQGPRQLIHIPAWR
jgi:hypothetical protein